MTDQDKIPRFANGEPVHPFGKPKNRLRTLVVILATWAFAITVLIGILWLMISLVGERHAHAQEQAPQDPSVVIFDKAGECSIDIDLHVTGSKRAACVDKLDTATRLAKAEMRINERRKH
jgi:hypothetical protein